MKRICVIGSSGSGKTTTAAALARREGLPHIELDSIYHQPGWTELPVAEFRARVDRLTEDERWIIDGNYTDYLQDIVWERADTIVWLDMPRRLVMRRIILRSLGRLISRKKLWNENRESVRNLLSRDPMKSIIVWAWTYHGKYLERYAEARQDPRWSHVTFIRLQTPNEVARFLNQTQQG